jgi:hypothetical protein
LDELQQSASQDRNLSRRLRANDFCIGALAYPGIGEFHAAPSHQQKTCFSTLPLTANLIRPLVDQVIE